MENKQYEKFTSDMAQDLTIEQIDGDMLYEMVKENIDNDEEFIKIAKYLKKQGVIDIVGRLSDDIWDKR